MNIYMYIYIYIIYSYIFINTLAKQRIGTYNFWTRI